MRQDAIVWRVDASHLLPMVPHEWIAKAVRDHRADVIDRRGITEHHDGGRGRPFWYPQIDLKSHIPAISVITASGQVPFHVDLEFPPYTAFLLVRPNGYNITGARRWSGGERQIAGEMLCLNIHRAHALADRHEKWTAHRFRQFNSSYALSPPSRIWIALHHDCETIPDPVAEVAFFHNTLIAVDKASKPVYAGVDKHPELDLVS